MFITKNAHASAGHSCAAWARRWLCRCSMRWCPAMAAAPSPITRYSFLHVPHGASPGYWTPKGEGKSWELSPILQPLAAFKDHITVVSNTDHAMAGSLSPEESAGDHSRTAAVYLSGAHPKRTEGQDIHCGITIDQVLRREDRPGKPAAVAGALHRGRRRARRLRRRL